jgi:hypothetical protein
VIIFKLDNKPVEQFINKATLQDAACVAHGLDFCTETVQAVSRSHPDDFRKKVVFVDTPGLGDYAMKDVDVFAQVARWLIDV